eukprot:COSAG05_NODE_4813_length_1362_cov_1.548694_1_plen_21_part_10
MGTKLTDLSSSGPYGAAMLMA